MTVRYYLRFLIERIFRIYPLFLVILFLSFIAISNTPYLQHQGTETWVGDFWFFPMPFYQTLKQAILVIRIPEAAGLRLIPQDWTLTVELLAGATVPLLAFAGKRHLLLFVALLAVLKLGNFFTTYVFEFGLGVFLFLIRDNIIAVWKKLSMAIKIFIAVAAVFFYTGFFVFPALYSQEIELVNGVVDRMIVAVGCMLFFVILLSSARLQKILSMSFLVTVGKICYSIYLVHKLLLMIWWRSFEEFFNSMASRGPLAVLLFYIVYIALVLALSYVFFKLVEKPANMLGKRVSRMLDTPFRSAQGTMKR